MVGRLARSSKLVISNKMPNILENDGKYLEVGKEDGSNADSDYDQDDDNPYGFDEEQMLDPYITMPETETIQVELTVTETIQVELTVGAKIEDLKAAVLRQRELEKDSPICVAVGFDEREPS